MVDTLDDVDVRRVNRGKEVLDVESVWRWGAQGRKCEGREN
jgi:hypothetical protein